MRRALLASGVVAALVHGFLLFGLDLDQAAQPLPTTPAPLVVGLVAAAPPPAPAPPEPIEQRPVEPPATRVARPPPVAKVHPKPSAPKSSEPVATAAPQETTAQGAEPETATLQAGGAAAPAGAAGSVTSAVPRYRSTPAPEYPAAARRRREEGVVLLAVDVSAAGRPTAVAVKRSSGFPLLDDAAVSGVRRWRFVPAHTAGLPIASQVEIPIRFSLTE